MKILAWFTLMVVGSILSLGFEVARADEYVRFPDTAKLQAVFSGCRMVVLRDLSLAPGPEGSKSFQGAPRVTESSSTSHPQTLTFYPVLDLISLQSGILELSAGETLAIDRIMPDVDIILNHETSSLVPREIMGDNTQMTKIYFRSQSGARVVLNAFTNVWTSSFSIPLGVFLLKFPFGEIRPWIDFDIECRKS